MAGRLELDRSAMAELCQLFGVARLAVLGSAVTDRFDPDRSDVDFLVEFRDEARASFKPSSVARLGGNPAPSSAGGRAVRR